MDGADQCWRCRPEGDLMTADEVELESDLLAERATGEPALVVDVEGVEAPLDLLLRLARLQKVDLAKVALLALDHQELAFNEEARQPGVQPAADSCHTT